jgi:predicted Zn-dependent protease
MRVSPVAVASQAEIQKSVRAALKEGRHDEAKVTLAAALDRWPDAYWMLMLHAEVLKASGDLAEALAQLRAIHERFPDKHWAAQGVIRLLFEEDRQAEARAFFENAVWTSTVPDETKSQMITALSPRRGNLDETICFRASAASPKCS